MKKNLLYHIKIILAKESGDIHHAECGCPAGLGPSGSCKHIAALAYALEEYSRIRSIRDQVACTSELQTWNRPRKQKLDPADIRSIKFVKLEHDKVKRPMKSKLYDPRPPEHCHTSNTEIQHLISYLKETNPSIAFLHVLNDTSIP